MDWEATAVSVALAVGTAAGLLVPGLWLGRWLGLTRSAARPWVEALLMLPLMLPPTVIGLYFLLALGQGSPLGRWLLDHLGLRLVFTFEGLLLASMLVNLPFMAQPVQRAYEALPNSLREAAWVCGLGAWRTFCRIELPLVGGGVLAGLALTVAHTLGEFGVVLMVGGNIPGVTRTASIAIYDSVQALDYSAALRTSGVLVVLSLVILALTSRLLGGLVLQGGTRR